MSRIFLLLATMFAVAMAANRTIVVTGATGHSGSKIYLLLKSMGFNVRGLVRSTSKAKLVLKCSKCDESEGIFIGDITEQTSMAAAMVNADSLVIATGTGGGTKPKNALFDGVENQVGAFLGSPGPKPSDRHVVLLSMQETTLLDTIFNKILARLWGGWDVGFYSLQGEAALMSANVPFTILKACSLADTPGMQQELLVGHDDKDWDMRTVHGPVSRDDLARVLATAAANPTMSSGLRFDFCAKPGKPQADAMDVLKAAMFKWDPRKASSAAMTVV